MSSSKTKSTLTKDRAPIANLYFANKCNFLSPSWPCFSNSLGIWSDTNYTFGNWSCFWKTWDTKWTDLPPTCIKTNSKERELNRKFSSCVLIPFLLVGTWDWIHEHPTKSKEKIGLQVWFQWNVNVVKVNTHANLFLCHVNTWQVWTIWNGVCSQEFVPGSPSGV